jgi:serine protease Do
VVRLHPEIRALALEYVLLRLGNMRGVDLSIFEVDFDLTWNALFLSPEGQVLGRFGGRDADTIAKYQTLPALKRSLQAAFDRHRHEKAAKPTPRKPIFAEDYPAAAKRPDNACIHCHHVHEFRRDALQHAGKWSLDDVWIYPQPENIGLTLDADEGNRVIRVEPNSAAAKIGMRTKDAVRKIGATPIASVADVQAALQRAPKKGTLTLEWERDRKQMNATLSLIEGWRKTDVSWRWSLKSLSPNPGIIGDDLDVEARKALNLQPNQLAYRQMNFLTPAARHAGLQANDVIVGIGDEKLTMNARQFETHIRLYYRVGQEVMLNVLRGKEKVKVKLKLAE